MAENYNTAFGRPSFMDVMSDYLSRTNSARLLPKTYGYEPGAFSGEPDQIRTQARQSLGASLAPPPSAPTLPASPGVERPSDDSIRSMARSRLNNYPEPSGRTGPIGRPLWGNTASVTYGDGTRRNLDVGSGFSAPVNMTPIEYQRATGRDMESGQWDMLARELLNQSANTYGNPNKADNLANLANIASRMSSRGEYGIQMANIGERARQSLANEGIQQAQMNKWEAETDIARQKAPYEIAHLGAQTEKYNAEASSDAYNRRTVPEQLRLREYDSILKRLEGGIVPDNEKSALETRAQALRQEILGGRTNYQQERPPIPDAQKAPDGRWYIQKEGKWFLVQ
jgi:hypothetical protein